MQDNEEENSEPSILCLDTCSVLDILRNPLYRKDITYKEHSASLRLLGVAESGKDLEVRVAPQVRDEFNTLADEIQREALDKQSRFIDEIQEYDQLVNLHGGSGTIENKHWNAHVQRCRQAADRWLTVAEIAAPPTDIAERVLNRAMKPLRPARPNKEAMKDCMILETYFDFVAQLRRNSLQKVIFVSSNTNDYANERRNDVADEIKAEFRALNIEYAPNMQFARGLLGL